jgi:5,10-methylenetetrahydromethanopterin reductase
MNAATSFGVMFRREYGPELLVDFARRVEEAGFDELWVVEDLGFHGGFAQAVAALAATQRITVGIGIAPAVARNTGFLAMEVATTARLFPGRFHMGLGHGVDTWIEQVGATPMSWLASLGEVTKATKRLVRGETVSMDGRYLHLDRVELVHPVRPPAIQPLISFGVRQPKSIALAAEVADGVILAECSGPAYVAQTRAVLGDSSRLTVFINVTTDIDAARVEVDRRIAQGRFSGQLRVYEGTDTDLYTEIIICGPTNTWRAQCERFIEAGADAIVFVPLSTDPPEVLETLIAALQA